MNDKRFSKEEIFSPYYQITTAKEMWVFTLRICDMLDKGEISENEINKTILVNNVLKIQCNWNSHTLTDFAHNLRLCVLGNCFIVIDEALNEIFGDKPKGYSDTDIDALRAIVYMLRCAVAHGPTSPCWEVRGIYRRKFIIREIGFELDATNIDGKILKHIDYGRLKGITSLINYSLEIVKRNHPSKSKQKTLTTE